jgi:hypothetical protein
VQAIPYIQQALQTTRAKAASRDLRAVRRVEAGIGGMSVLQVVCITGTGRLQIVSFDAS